MSAAEKVGLHRAPAWRNVSLYACVDAVLHAGLPGQLATAARRTRVLVLLVLVFLLSCRSVPRQFHVESIYPRGDNRNILFACEISQLNIYVSGFHVWFFFF